VPFRDSKLTALLRGALGGSVRTALVAAVTPVATSAQETLATLHFADRARRVRCASGHGELSAALTDTRMRPPARRSTAWPQVSCSSLRRAANVLLAGCTLPRLPSAAASRPDTRLPPPAPRRSHACDIDTSGSGAQPEDAGTAGGSTADSAASAGCLRSGVGPDAGALQFGGMVFCLPLQCLVLMLYLWWRVIDCDTLVHAGHCSCDADSVAESGLHDMTENRAPPEASHRATNETHSCSELTGKAADEDPVCGPLANFVRLHAHDIPIALSVSACGHFGNVSIALSALGLLHISCCRWHFGLLTPLQSP
jgi:hypothetical protein